MPMVTRCPSCNTAFRVTPQQLQAHNGDVRCGRCMMVFDGFKGLAVLPEPASTEPENHVLPQTAVQAHDGMAGEDSSEHQEPAAEQDRQSELTPVPSSAAGMPGFEVAADGPSLESAVPQPVPMEHRGESEPNGSTAATWPLGVIGEASDEERMIGPTPRSRWWWAAGSALLLLLLAGQATYYYRVEIASKYPVLKPLLTSLCRAAGCMVPLPQRPGLVYIEASDMQVVNPERPEVIRLTATLRNHAGYDVAFPALDLVLTNARDHSLARRIFMPAEYLDRPQDAKVGIPGNGEITIRLDLDIGDLAAAGFRLALLAAPMG